MTIGASDEPGRSTLAGEGPWAFGGFRVRAADQRTLAWLLSAGLLAMLICWWWSGGSRGLVDIDRAPAVELRFELDVNSAAWPELTLLPDIGETLARRIVESRERDGRFSRCQDLLRVKGIGPAKLARIRPYLRPIRPLDR